MKKLSILVLLIGAALAGLWLYGFLSFVDNVTSLREPYIGSGTPLEPAEAIVVLTGGSERVARGVSLLEAGDGKKLFISGVHKRLSLDGIIKSMDVPVNLRACCMVLGYQADSTMGNAEETRDWLKTEGYTSMRLVTANYHMPRSLLVFHAVLPNIKIVPHPVSPESVKLNEWGRHPGTIYLLATEYNKFLVAKMGLRIRESGFREKILSQIPAHDSRLPAPDSP
jgi:uncharacterized SAM-binding protein YcdF (DUF218 family)